MANANIDNCYPAETLDGSELVEIMQEGFNKQTTTQDIADLSASDIDAVLAKGSTAINRTVVFHINDDTNAIDIRTIDGSIVKVSIGLDDTGNGRIWVNSFFMRSPDDTGYFVSIANGGALLITPA